MNLTSELVNLLSNAYFVKNAGNGLDLTHTRHLTQVT